MVKLPKVYPIVDTGLLARRGFDPYEAARALIEGGAKILQLRHKEFFGRTTYELARRMAQLCHTHQVTFVIDDRPDIARLLEVGCHVGQDDIPPQAARKVLGEGLILGFSTHNRLQLMAGDREPVDYLALGPIFETRSKEKSDPVVGTETLRELRSLTQKPLVAIGGITRANALEVWQAGADSVAVISDLYPEPLTYEAIYMRMQEWNNLASSTGT